MDILYTLNTLEENFVRNIENILRSEFMIFYQTCLILLKISVLAIIEATNVNIIFSLITAL